MLEVNYWFGYQETVAPVPVQALTPDHLQVGKKLQVIGYTCDI